MFGVLTSLVDAVGSVFKGNLDTQLQAVSIRAADTDYERARNMALFGISSDNKRAQRQKELLIILAVVVILALMIFYKKK